MCSNLYCTINCTCKKLPLKRIDYYVLTVSCFCLFQRNDRLEALSPASKSPPRRTQVCVCEWSRRRRMRRVRRTWTAAQSTRKRNASPSPLMAVWAWTYHEKLHTQGFTCYYSTKNSVHSASFKLCLCLCGLVLGQTPICNGQHSLTVVMGGIESNALHSHCEICTVKLVQISSGYTQCINFELFPYDLCSVYQIKITSLAQVRRAMADNHWTGNLK